jgi:hypothetical protein
MRAKNNCYHPRCLKEANDITARINATGLKVFSGPMFACKEHGQRLINSLGELLRELKAQKKKPVYPDPMFR